LLLLSCSAPKAQPRKEANAPSPSLAAPATPAVLAAASVHVYKLNNGAYDTIGAAGMVVLGGPNLPHSILVYDSAKKPIVQAPVHAEFALPLQDGNYCSVTDPSGNVFSVRFNSPEDQCKIARAAAIGRVMAWKSGGSLVVQDLVLGKGQEIAKNDQVAVKYTGWLPGASGPASIGEVFDSNEGAQGKAFKFQIGVSKVIQGWQQGVTGMKKDGRRFLAIPSALAYGPNGSPPKIPPNSTLFFEIFVDKVKFEPAATAAAEPPASAQPSQTNAAVVSPSPAPAEALLSQEDQDKEALKARMAKLSQKSGGSSMGAMQGTEPRRDSVTGPGTSPLVSAQAAPILAQQQARLDAVESTAVVAVSSHSVGTFEKYSQQQQQQQQQQQSFQFQTAQQLQQQVLPVSQVVASLPSETVSDVKAIATKVDKIGVDLQILLDRTKIEKKDDAASMVGQALVQSVTRMVEDNEKLRSDISEKSLRLDELSRRVADLTETNRRLDERLRNFSADVSDREITSGMKSRFEVMESDMQILRTRIAEADARLKDSTQQLHEAKKDKSEALDRIQTLTEEIEEAKRGAQRLTKQLDERKAKMQSERDSYETRLEEQTSSHEAEVTKLKDQLHKAKLQGSRGGDDEIKKQVDEAESRWARTLDESKAAWEAERRALKNEIANLLKPQAPKDTADPIVELQRQALAQATEEHAKQVIVLRAQADADALEKSSAIASLTEKLQVDPLPSPLLFFMFLLFISSVCKFRFGCCETTHFCFRIRAFDRFSKLH
jgi:FK506-binding protein 15